MALELNGTTGVSLVQDGVVTAADLASGAITSAALPAGSVLQVVQTVKTDSASTSATSFSDISGMSATITPSSTSSKILVMVKMMMGHNPNTGGVIKIFRGSGEIGGAPSGIANWFYLGNGNTEYGGLTVGNDFLDSPSTTSATTYKLQWRADSANPIYINDTNLAVGSFGFGFSTITLMEIAG